MTLWPDPEVAAAVKGWATRSPAVDAGEYLQIRAMINGLTHGVVTPDGAEITVLERTVVAEDGYEIAVRVYRGAGEVSTGALLYVHGGGGISGTLDGYDRLCRYYAAEAGIQIVAVDYRLAPEHPHPADVQDTYAVLGWLAEHAGELGIDPEQIGIGGDCAGGGIAAGAALLARDRSGPALALQLLICPMLDDRNTVSDPAIAPFSTWTYEFNRTAWRARLGELAGTDAVPAYAAPARAAELAELPRAFIEVGDLDIFRDETLDYARRLVTAGTHVEAHLWPGLPHNYDAVGAKTPAARRALAVRIGFLATLLD
ncbi:alpha/beta hydrolase [Nocardia sp. NBC_01388]|uniref:alpha/beta hydrolase n=1 Tax=Nocardia sp. NBC_01388 TaxID=2903596 RepID=UPI003244AF7C